MKKKAIILISGGLDSATVLAMLSELDFQIHAMSFEYDQNHIVELQKVKLLIQDYNVFEHKIIKIDPSVFQSSALANKNLEIPKYNSIEEINNVPSKPLSYVPGRNNLFLSYALSYADSIGAEDIFVGMHSLDSQHYPDCSKEFIKSFQNTARAATNKEISIHAPLLDMTKAEIVAEGLKRHVNYANTISCYDPTQYGISCGSCLSCCLRLNAFAANNAIDEITYVKK